MTTELATTGGSPPATTGQGALALRPDQTEWTPMQEAALAQLGLKDAPPGDRMVFLHQCQRTGLDPFARQIYMIGRQDRTGTKWTIQTGIDGFRAVAEEHPEYEGQTPIEWCGPDGVWTDVWLSSTPPAAARCGVLRSDKREPIRAVVLFREFAQYKNDGSLTTMWKTKSAHMLGKCAEAGALRKAFPQRLSGIYTEDEAGSLDRQAPTVVTSQREPAGAVSVDELAGEQVHEGEVDPPGTAESASPSPAASPATGGPEKTGERMTSTQSRELFPLIRKAQVGDRNAWASRVLERDVTSFAQVSEADADKLLENARQLVAAAEEDEAEVVPEADGGS
jgi:phage recombination protein Bet